MNPIVHDLPGKLWCGPAVLAAITGLKTSAFEHLNDAGKCGISVVRETLRLHGYSMVQGANPGPDYRLDDFDELTLCIVDPGAGHWVLVQNGMLVDSGNRIPTPIKSTRFADSEVRFCYYITKL